MHADNVIGCANDYIRYFDNYIVNMPFVNS